MYRRCSRAAGRASRRALIIEKRTFSYPAQCGTTPQRSSSIRLPSQSSTTRAVGAPRARFEPATRGLEVDGSSNSAPGFHREIACTEALFTNGRSGHERPRENAICSYLVLSHVPTQRTTSPLGRTGGPRRGPGARPDVTKARIYAACGSPCNGAGRARRSAPRDAWHRKHAVTGARDPTHPLAAGAARARASRGIAEAPGRLAPGCSWSSHARTVPVTLRALAITRLLLGLGR
jgi:hypothetical protein